jgi:hypothetical protein
VNGKGKIIMASGVGVDGVVSSFVAGSSTSVVYAALPLLAVQVSTFQQAVLHAVQALDSMLRLIGSLEEEFEAVSVWESEGGLVT